MTPPASAPTTAPASPVRVDETDDIAVVETTDSLDTTADVADTKAVETDTADGRRATDEPFVVSRTAALDGIEPLPVIHHAGRWERFGKPVFDRGLALFVLILALPVLAVLALAILVTMGRPILYKQQRVGQDGKPFTMLKLRSMKADLRGETERRSGEDRRQQTVAVKVDRRDGEDRREAKDRRRTHKTQADPRHTSLGRFMRKFSLDELPQLINVLRGELSIIGPRPELVSVVENKYDDWQHRRHEVKPGLTGLWQVTLRDNEGLMHEHVDTDLRYVDNLGFALDMAIAFLTPAALLGKVLVESPRALTARFGREESSETLVDVRDSSGGHVAMISRSHAA